MKRAAFAQRLVFILFSVALTSIAIGAPPEWAQGEPPPFNEEDCVFADGRTVCEIVETSSEATTGNTSNYRTDRKCEDGRTLYEMRAPATKVITTIRVIFRGTSDVIESFETFSESIDLGFEVVGTRCR